MKAKACARVLCVFTVVGLGYGAGASFGEDPAPRGEASGKDSSPVEETAPLRAPSLERSGERIDGVFKVSHRGMIDTDLQLSSFFSQAHVVAAWVMPEYVYNDAGAIFASSEGVFSLGHGDYRRGDGGYRRSGSPVLELRVGQKRALYLAPGYRKRRWNHVALVRGAADSGGTYSFELYVNGERLRRYRRRKEGKRVVCEPLAPLGFGLKEALRPAPGGSLRLGRRLDLGASEKERRAQFYGLLDDVVVLRGAADVKGLSTLSSDELEGLGASVVRVWSFDAPVARGSAEGAALRPNARARQLFLSSPRGDEAGRAALDDPRFVSPSSARRRLPFPKGEVWRVTQGSDAPWGTHNGYATFCWDFSRVKKPRHAPIVSATAGVIVNVKEGVPEGSKGAEPTKIHLKVDDDAVDSYMHIADGSFSALRADRGVEASAPQTKLEDSWVAVERGAKLALVGPRGRHLHFAANDSKLGGTMPVAFVDYEVSDDRGKTWRHVEAGMPRSKQYLRRLR